MTARVPPLLAVALAGWLMCFIGLAHFDTWLPFAFFGSALALVALRSQALSRDLLRPSYRASLQGIFSGAAMVLATHAAYRLVVTVAPSVGAATRELLALLHESGHSTRARAALIVLIASCEELLFRGLLPVTRGAGPPRRSRRLAPRETLTIGFFTLAYALTTAPLGSPLLLVCALICGAIWTFLRLATDSLLVPLLTHVIWDLGVLLVWPLSSSVL